MRQLCAFRDLLCCSKAQHPEGSTPQGCSSLLQLAGALPSCLYAVIAEKQAQQTGWAVALLQAPQSRLEFCRARSSCAEAFCLHAAMAEKEAQQTGRAVALLQAAQSSLAGVPKLAAAFDAAAPRSPAEKRQHFDADLAAFVDTHLKKVERACVTSLLL